MTSSVQIQLQIPNRLDGYPQLSTKSQIPDTSKSNQQQMVNIKHSQHLPRVFQVPTWNFQSLLSTPSHFYPPPPQTLDYSPLQLALSICQLKTGVDIQLPPWCLRETAARKLLVSRRPEETQKYLYSDARKVESHSVLIPLIVSWRNVVETIWFVSVPLSLPQKRSMGINLWVVKKGCGLMFATTPVERNVPNRNGNQTYPDKKVTEERTNLRKVTRNLWKVVAAGRHESQMVP